MRMWLVDPSVMCQKHLSGEHVEMHMFIGSLDKGLIKVHHYHNLLEYDLLQSRHDELVVEMTKRGWNHQSPIKGDLTNRSWYDTSHNPFRIDREASLRELMRRCPECRKRYLRPVNLVDIRVALRLPVYTTKSSFTFTNVSA